MKENRMNEYTKSVGQRWIGHLHNVCIKNFITNLKFKRENEKSFHVQFEFIEKSRNN